MRIHIIPINQFRIVNAAVDLLSFLNESPKLINGMSKTINGTLDELELKMGKILKK